MSMIPRRNRRLADRRVNRGSRLLALIGVLFTAIAVPSAASADAIALLPLTGRAEAERLQRVEQLAAEILREQGHRIVPPGSTRIQGAPSSAQMEAVAAETSATYVVTAEVEPLRAQYRLHVYVYYRPAGRTEDLVATVLEAEERARLSDILSAMVRRQGLGEDALRLTGEPEDPDAAAAAERARLEEEARRAREEEEAARREEEEAARREAEEAMRREAEEQARREEEARRAARTAWDARVPYGADAPWMVQLVVGGRYAVPLGALPVMPPPGAPQPRQGGGLFDLGVRIGRSFEGVDGFELRGGLDFHTGAFTALGVHVGAAWLGSFFVEPVFIGLGGDVGVIFTLTGAQDVGFSGQVSALFAWRPVDRFYLEASLPEIGIVSPGSGAVTIGASLRAGYRF